MIILDTNVIAEAMRPEPTAAVMDWLKTHPRSMLATTAVSVGEILRGLYRMPEGRRRANLETRFQEFMWRAFRGNVLAFDNAAAGAYARVSVGREKVGRRTGDADAMIAGIAVALRAAVATRNVAGFENFGVSVINPWDWRGAPQ